MSWRAPADGEGRNTTLAVMPARWGEMLCYRCQEFGHASYACKSNENRAQKCLNCGEEEHEAKDYEGEEACYICNGGLRTSLANRRIKMNETNKTENTKTGKTCHPVLLGGDRDKKKKQNSPLRDKDEGGKQRKTVLTKLKENAEEMVSFAQANKNVHREVKSLAREETQAQLKRLQEEYKERQEEFEELAQKVITLERRLEGTDLIRRDNGRLRQENRELREMLKNPDKNRKQEEHHNQEQRLESLESITDALGKIVVDLKLLIQKWRSKMLKKVE
ncbi:hypothetical protein GEV33_001228 [Tenebrio molitor]|uniref:CCHC-type domain-containing protein n=1 Tax=Tenebrio molitor TaxID=7067 RepID=A0A8J6HWT8_TENMO|nr:hypothetical protein GEV33_001228 [Tenebrio molitor]